MKTFFQALIPALWLVWLAFWVLAARKAKEKARQEGTGSRLLHAAPLIAAGALLASPHMLGTRMEGRFHAHTFGWFLVGLGLVVLGLGSYGLLLWLFGVAELRHLLAPRRRTPGR